MRPILENMSKKRMEASLSNELLSFAERRLLIHIEKHRVYKMACYMPGKANERVIGSSAHLPADASAGGIFWCQRLPSCCKECMMCWDMMRKRNVSVPAIVMLHWQQWLHADYMLCHSLSCCLSSTKWLTASRFQLPLMAVTTSSIAYGHRQLSYVLPSCARNRVTRGALSRRC